MGILQHIVTDKKPDQSFTVTLKRAARGRRERSFHRGPWQCRRRQRRSMATTASCHDAGLTPHRSTCTYEDIYMCMKIFSLLCRRQIWN